MAAEIQTQDTELEQLVNQLNTLQGDQKIEALTAAVTNLAGQRLMLHHQWETMHDMMSGTNMAGTNNPANTNGWQHQQTPQAPR